VNEVWGLAENSRRVLQATAVEANGRPGMYVLRAHILSRANISELAELQLIAEHLERKGSIAEADADYVVFVLTPEGLDEAMS
jgi:hypothetical protein